MVNLLILGAGTAGLTAAIYGTRAGMSVKVIESNIYGGQVVTAPKIDNYPGMPGISGADFILSLYNQAKDSGAEILFETPLSASLKGDIKRIVTSKGEHEAQSVIIATGTKPRKLGVPGEEKFIGRGIAFCATCDGAFFKNKDVAIIGGGNVAIGDALLLSGLCRLVTIIHRSSDFKAEEMLLNLIKTKDNVRILMDTAVLSFNGNNSLETIELENTKTGTRDTLSASGVFLAIGAEPNNSVFASEVNLDKNGYVIASEDCVTNVPGVFAAGDARTKKVRQLVTSAADGAIAALAAKEYLDSI